MTPEGLDPILIQVTIPLPVPMIYSAFTDSGHVKGWLADEAQVTAEVGGAYHLAWKQPARFESPGKVVRMTPDVDIGFTWFAPPPFDQLMNQPSPLTQVYVRLQESPEGVDVTLEHEGWGATEPWEEARSWHFHFWDERLTRLKDYLIKLAYG
ncbi:MAG TPA: SRPBCC domain-containing protein [Thermoplasmata archaeon]|nr:SRPBCC domain-containing protein [Thermoplasmata archaeon]